MVRESHPNLIEDYFRDIDTKEKAYWLGFIYADGCVDTRRGQCRLNITLASKDEDQLDRFIEAIGYNPAKKQLTEGSRRKAGIWLHHRRFVEHLMSHGVVPRKTAIIRLPPLESRDLDLAFLLGYFDGDGSISSGVPSLACGSVEFLRDVCNRFALGYHPCHNGGLQYSLYLGGDLYNEMLRNFSDSMPRKRQILPDRPTRRSRYDPTIPRNVVRPPHPRERERCPKGHQYDEENTYHNSGKRHCRACRVEAQRAYRSRQKQVRS